MIFFFKNFFLVSRLSKRIAANVCLCLNDKNKFIEGMNDLKLIMIKIWFWKGTGEIRIEIKAS